MWDSESGAIVVAIRGIFLLLLSAGHFLLQAPASAQADPSPFLCLPADAAWIEGPRLGDRPADVERELGIPAHRTVGLGEDDGGTYEEIKLSYPKLDVFLVRGVVDRVVTTDPETCTANGICPGLTQQQVRNRLEQISPALAALEPSSFVLCPVDSFLSDYYLLIDYTITGEVERLELVLDRP